MLYTSIHCVGRW